MKIKLIIIFLLCFLKEGFTQDITGSILDKAGEPVISATVVLQTNDSLFISATTSDSKGFFKLPFNGDEFILNIQHLLYNTKIIRSEKRNLGKILLDEKQNLLSEITITAKVPHVEIEENGALKYNMQILTQNRPLQNALELLNEVSSVEKNGNSYNIIGTGGTTILINGRKNNMTNSQVYQMLSSMPANQVENIEVFYSTPPSYGIRGASINFVLKKKKTEKLSVNGEVFTTVDQGYYFDIKGGINLRLSKQKWSWNIGYTPGREKNLTNQIFDSYHQIENDKHVININNNSKTKHFFHNIVSDFSYDFTNKKSINILYTGNLKNNDSNQQSFLNKDGITSIEENLLNGSTSFHTIALDVKLDKIKIGGNYLFYKENKNQHLSNKSNNADLNSLAKQRADKWSVYINSNNIIGKSNLQYGINWEAAKVHNNYDINDDNQLLTDNSFLTNQDENSISAFTTWSRSFNKRTNLSISLEAEYFNSNYSAEDGTKYKLWSEFYLYPSVLFIHKMKSNSIFQVSLNSKKTYPSYWQTISGTTYINSYWQTQGNSTLKPYSTYQFNLNYIIQKRYIIGLSAILSPDYFTQQMYQDDKTLKVMTKFVNFDYDRKYVLMCVTPVNWTNWFNSRLTATGIYLSQKGYVSNISFSRNKLTGRFFLTNNFTLDRQKCWSLQLDGLYQLPAIQGLYDVGHIYEISAGLSWTPKKSPWKLTLKANDLFDSYRQKSFVDYANQLYDLNMNLNRQSVSLSIQYTFKGYKDNKYNKVDSSRFGL